MRCCGAAHLAAAPVSLRSNARPDRRNLGSLTWAAVGAEHPTSPQRRSIWLSRWTATSTVTIGYVRLTSILLKNPLFWREHLGFVAMSARQTPGSSPHVAKMGVGSGMSFASFRRFWAVAASRKSSLAPLGPRTRNRSSRRMRFRCSRRASRPSFVRDMRRRRPRSWRSHGPCHERLHERSERPSRPSRSPHPRPGVTESRSNSFSRAVQHRLGGANPS